MVTEELEQLLQGAEERDNLEFKAGMAWDTSLVKDVLAMANLQDGGRIVVGLEDGTLSRQGVTEAQAQTFNMDLVKDAVAPFADPYVDLTTEIVKDASGTKFIVITVHPFESLPVICKRDGGSKNELQAGTVYYRSKSKRPASARISTAIDMRTVLDFAVVKRMEYIQKLGLAPVAVGASPSFKSTYDDELGGL